jgi:hypothetical protein
LHIQVARVDLEARRIEFRLVPKNSLRSDVGSAASGGLGRVRSASRASAEVTSAPPATATVRAGTRSGAGSATRSGTRSGTRAGNGKPVLTGMDQARVARKLSPGTNNGSGKKRASAAAKPARGAKAARRQKR